MPRLSLDYLKSLTEVVHDVQSPRVSIPRAGFERRSCSLLRRLHQLNQSSPSQSCPAVPDCAGFLFPLYPHFRRVGMRRRLSSKRQVGATVDLGFNGHQRGARHEKFDGLEAL
jgi:hypothetical protein